MAKLAGWLAISCLAWTAALSNPAANAGELPTPAPTPTPKSEAAEQAYWSTPGDGTLTMLIRNAKSFQAPIPFRARVCVTNFTGVNNVVNLMVWTTPGYAINVSTSQQPQTHTLALGECAEIDQPAAIIVQDSTTSGIASGYYQILERTPAPPKFDPSPAAADRPKRHEHEIIIGKRQSIAVKCVAYPDAEPGGVFPPPAAGEPVANGDYYSRYCRLDQNLFASGDPKKPTRGLRICTDAKYVNSGGKYGDTYAAGLLGLALDKAAIGVEKDSPYNYNFNPITWNSCRDAFFPGDIYFMVGPGPHGQYWDSNNVNSVNVTVFPLSWTDPD